MSKYGFKRPYEYVCPNCGHTGDQISYGGHRAQFVDRDELSGLLIEYYGCPECGQMWDVEYEVSYKVSKIVKKGFDEDIKPLDKE